MACYRPLRAWRARKDLSKIVFKPAEGNWNHALQLPCGRCIGCRLDYSRKWAIRLEHERSLHEESMFLTLTYRPEDLPPGGTLVKKHYQDFMKRLRSWVDYEFPDSDPIRFYACGEYGSKLLRPHYHAIIYGFRMPDEVLFRTTPAGHDLFKSEKLAELWGHGFVTIGDCTFESAAYVARYVTKKRRHKSPKEMGDWYDGRIPEFSLMSRRPGIAKAFFDAHKGEMYPADQVFARGRLMKPPRFYDKLFELHHPEEMVKIKEQRKQRGIEAAAKDPPTRTRMATKEEHKRLVTKTQLMRIYEDGEA